MNFFIETFINGLSLGGIYALIALGYTMVYGIAKMLNFAHGDIIMAGGYTILVGLTMSGIPAAMEPWMVWIGLAAAVLFCVLLGVFIEKIAYKPLRGASPLAILITAIGVSYFLQSMAQILFGSNTKMVILFSDADSIMTRTWYLGGVPIRASALVTLLVTAAVMVLLSLFVKYTRTGRAMVAVSEDRGAAQLMGVNVNRIITVTFAIGSALAALAGFFYLVKAPSIVPTFGSMPGIKAFTAAVIGGIGSIPGAMLGGILLGVVECFASSVPVLAPYTDAVEFAILIVILLVKPTGILGKKRREKV